MPFSSGCSDLDAVNHNQKNPTGSKFLVLRYVFVWLKLSHNATGVVYKLGVLGHFAPWDILFNLGGIRTFCPKNQTKTYKMGKDFWIISVILAFFVCQNDLLIPNYILLAKKIDKFWSGSIISICNIKSLCAELF